ncbi:MAG: hypothetical protein CL899_01915 [Dehalococcoidia bacterium]|mgnify:FL=1|nr:hypothetical protein [Dehalococcoidia bacterium]|tara:strand:+ start:451 stop:1326 length:876 start_codon:yes stop_codon:yes gene_type:complete
MNSYGGQAVINGVMIMGRNTSVIAVRSPAEEIIKREISIKKLYSSKFNKIPILRGILSLLDQLRTGVKAINLSEAISRGEKDSEETVPNLSGFQLFLTFSVSLLFVIGIFLVGPAVVSRILNSLGLGDFLISIIEGIIRLSLVIAYIFFVGLSDEFKKLFQYHGAEHMAIWTHDNKDDLTIDNLKKYSKEHPRCGTSFIFLVILISIILFTFVPTSSIIFRVIFKILLLPIVIGVSYELLKFASSSKSKILKSILNAPGIWIQFLTTRKPDNSQMEVAIESLKFAIELNED